jgi:hypothetical protein
VEEMAAAASSLKSQALELVQVVAVFKLDANKSAFITTVRSSTPRNIPFKGSTPTRTINSGSAKPKSLGNKPALAKPVSLPKPASTEKTSVAGGGDNEWETF